MTPEQSVMTAYKSESDGEPGFSVKGKHILTGPFNYSGSFLARLLLKSGAGEVHGLVGHNRKSPEDLAAVRVHPMDFSRPDELARAMEGAEVFYNTYWVRFNHKNFTHRQAVENTKLLFKAARQAGVSRVVHISITNPDLNSPFEYFRGKAELEEELRSSGLSYAILRPAVLFGGHDILINNIAWALRTFPLLGVFGRGDYGIRPIHVQDLAGLMLDYGQSRADATINAVAPERFTYRGLVERLAAIMGLRRPVFSCPPPLAYAVGKVVGWLHNDVFITWPEVGGLMAGLLDTPESPEEAPGRILLSQWAEEHKSELGRVYASELARR